MKTKIFVLGLHPTSRGFGWILFDGPLSAFDWGAPHPSRDKHDACLSRLRKLLTHYRPTIVTLEHFEGVDSRRAPRIRELGTAMIALARESGSEVAVYPRNAISRTFATTATQTRQDIAELVAREIAQLRSYLPRPRKLWEGEHSSLAIFCAAACALTWYAEHL